MSEYFTIIYQPERLNFTRRQLQDRKTVLLLTHLLYTTETQIIHHNSVNDESLEMEHTFNMVKAQIFDRKKGCWEKLPDSVKHTGMLALKDTLHRVRYRAVSEEEMTTDSFIRYLQEDIGWDKSYSGCTKHREGIEDITPLNLDT